MLVLSLFKSGGGGGAVGIASEAILVSLFNHVTELYDFSKCPHAPLTIISIFSLDCITITYSVKLLRINNS